VGLRDHSMRTPGQFQQNFPREMAMNEAAALAGADPLQFRIDHAKDERLLNVLRHLQTEAGWETRKTPKAAASGQATVRGQGMSAMFRSGTYWACACEVSVTPATGVVKVEKYTVVVEPGIVVNPEQLKRQVEGGAVMGISIALHEEVNFNQSAITTANWSSYPIATMADVPEIKIVMLHRPEVGQYGQGSEAANALAPSAIASAVFDATGKPMRTMPLRPANVMEMLKA
jgi:CO/xanthine dehydrogenase Mo-binding subunit